MIPNQENVFFSNLYVCLLSVFVFLHTAHRALLCARQSDARPLADSSICASELISVRMQASGAAAIAFENLTKVTQTQEHTKLMKTMLMETKFSQDIGDVDGSLTEDQKRTHTATHTLRRPSGFYNVR